MACAMRAPRATRYCAAGLELMPTAMRSRIATGSWILLFLSAMLFQAAVHCCATWRKAISRSAIRLLAEEIAQRPSTRSCG